MKRSGCPVTEARAGAGRPAAPASRLSILVRGAWFGRDISPPRPKQGPEFGPAQTAGPRCGVAKDEAEKQLADWERKASDSWFTKS